MAYWNEPHVMAEPNFSWQDYFSDRATRALSRNYTEAMIKAALILTRGQPDAAYELLNSEDRTPEYYSFKFGRKEYDWLKENTMEGEIFFVDLMFNRHYRTWLNKPGMGELDSPNIFWHYRRAIDRDTEGATFLEKQVNWDIKNDWSQDTRTRAVGGTWIK